MCQTILSEINQLTYNMNVSVQNSVINKVYFGEKKCDCAFKGWQFKSASKVEEAAMAAVKVTSLNSFQECRSLHGHRRKGAHMPRLRRPVQLPVKSLHCTYFMQLPAIIFSDAGVTVCNIQLCIFPCVFPVLIMTKAYKRG